MIELSIIGITTLFLIMGSYFDLRTGEIPEKISIGLIVTILIYSLIYSVYTGDIDFFGNALLLGAGYFILAYILFYMGEWGGGDVKLLTGIGCSLAFLDAAGYFKDVSVLPYYIDYLINMALISAPYLIIYSLILGLMKKEVIEEFIGYFKTRTTLLLIILSFIPAIFSLWISIGPSVTLIYLCIPFIVVLSFYLRAVEIQALQKTVAVDELMEWDVVAEDIKVDDKKIASKRDIEGLTRNDIKAIKELAAEGKIPKEIRIKWGIKFAPILFLAFVASVLVGNLMEISVAYIFGNTEFHNLMYPFQ